MYYILTGMKAGDNTLNSAVEFMETMQRVDPYRMKEVRGIVSEDYVKFIACQLLVEDQIFIFP